MEWIPPTHVTEETCPVGARVLLTEHIGSDICKYEYEVLEWSPSKKRVKFRNLLCEPPLPTFWVDAEKYHLLEKLSPVVRTDEQQRPQIPA